MPEFDNFPKRFSRKMDVGSAVVRAFQEHIIKSYAPTAPFLPRSARVVSIGSCFAEEISKSLTQEGLEAAHITMSERWNSAFALRLFLLKAMRGTPFPPGFIADNTVMDTMVTEAESRLATADLFVLTFGLSLCWFEVASGRMILEPKITPTKAGMAFATQGYEMRQTALSENEDAIRACITEIKAFNPTAKIVLTLSPVPLLASLGGPSVIAANTISKSTLRLALHNVVSQQLPDVFYWPSYECVTWTGNHVTPVFGGDDRDMRHVRPDLVSQIAKLFKGYYFIHPV